MSRQHAKVGVGRRWYASLVRTAAALLVALLTTLAIAAPYVPPTDDTILEQLPSRAALARLAPLRDALAANRRDLPATLALATEFIELGRHESDPRFIAYAQAALLPWMARPEPPERVLVLQAITLQYLHQFDAALTLLARALSREPLDGQAWLTRAALLELRGDYAAARLACARLARAADEFSALTCLGSVASRNGRLAASYAALATPAPLDASLSPALRAWRLTVRADMAERLGQDSAAENDLRAALRATTDEPYLKAAYADLLLRTGRPREVLPLLAGSESQDALLLRLAIAAHRLESAAASQWMQAYEARWQAAERDGDTTHQREQALYLLELRGDAAGALDLARRNWAVQREPADLRIYARAAATAGSAQDCERIAAWLAETRYEDRTLATSPSCTPPREGRP